MTIVWIEQRLCLLWSVLCLLWSVLKGWRVFAGVRSQADGDTLQQLHSGITPVIIDVTS
jgi:hypothetical protein